MQRLGVIQAGAIQCGPSSCAQGKIRHAPDEKCPAKSTIWQPHSHLKGGDEEQCDENAQRCVAHAA